MKWLLLLAPAFGRSQRQTIVGVPHQEVIRQLVAGIEEEGLKARVISSRIPFLDHVAEPLEGDSISGSGVCIGIQSKRYYFDSPTRFTNHFQIWNYSLKHLY